MTLINFLAKNGFIRTISEVRRLSEQKRVLLNNNPVPINLLNQTEVVMGDEITVGTNVVRVFEGP